MHSISQAAIARETGLSPMTVHRRLQMLDRTDGRPTELDALLVIASQEGEISGLTRTQAIDMLADHHSTLRWLAGSAARQAWLVSYERGKLGFSSVAMSDGQLQSLLESLPNARALPLHTLVARARRRVATMNQRLSRREAA